MRPVTVLSKPEMMGESYPHAMNYQDKKIGTTRKAGGADFNMNLGYLFTMTVPVSPLRASTALARDVMMAFFSG